MIWIAPKSPRGRPPSLASAPTIWRGSTFWRLPDLDPVGRHRPSRRGAAASPGASAPRGRGRRGRPVDRAPRSSRAAGRESSRLEQQGGVALGDDGERGGDIDLGHVVVRDVVADDVAELLRSAVGWPRAAVIASSKRASRVALTSSTLGSCICVSGWRVAFSIAASRRRSRGVTKLIASPLRPARPVRPMRCTYDSVSIGMSKLTTWLMRSTSRPRAATSVATRMSSLPDFSWLDGALALRLGDVAVDRRGRVAAGAELLGERLGLVLGAGEDDHALEVLDLEDAGEGVDLLRVRDDQVALGRVGRGRGLVLDRDLFGVVQVLLRDATDLRRHRGREQRDLLGRPGCRRGSSRRPRRSPS